MRADRPSSTATLIAAATVLLARDPKLGHLVPAGAAEICARCLKGFWSVAPRLRWLAFHAEVATRTHYVSFTVPKKSGGQRTLSAPHRTMARAQRWIFEQMTALLGEHAPHLAYVRVWETPNQYAQYSLKPTW